MKRTAYWEECLMSSFDEHGIKATPEQIRLIAEDVEIGIENYGMAFHVPENPLRTELDDAKAKLQEEKEKVFCKVCNGKGSIIEYFGSRSSISQCWNCGGEGKHKPSLTLYGGRQ